VKGSAGSIVAAALLAMAGAALALPAAAQQSARAPAGFEEQFRAARQLANSGRRDEAIAAYTALLERHPGNADVLLGRGRVYAWEKRWEEAERDLRAATQRSPRYADAWAGLGDMYLWSDRPAEAAAAYGQWVELKPRDPEARMARGRAHRAAGQFEPARADFEAAGALGAPRDAVEDAQRSLAQRIANPDASAAAGYDWQLQAGASHTGYAQSRGDVTDHYVALRRYFEHASLALEWLNVDRFDKTDTAWALDSYVDLWRRAYANLRYQHGPDHTLFPETAWRAELFQGVGEGWELSAGFDQLLFNSNTVDIYSVGVGKYVGAWYLRWKHLFTHSNTSDGNGDQLLGRWYWAGDADSYLELRGGIGRSTQELAGVPGATTARDSGSVGVALSHFPRPRWGYKLAASYGDDADFGEALGGSATLYLRW
jgi:YaiO family outer membrane protein